MQYAKRLAVFSVVILFVFGVMSVVPAFADDYTTSIESGTMVFQGSLDVSGDAYSGTIAMVDGDGESGLADGEDGFDVYARNGSAAMYKGTGDDYVHGLVTGHDAYTTAGGWGSEYNPDCADYEHYQLRFADGKWYLEYKTSVSAGEGIATPMSGTMDWVNMYAIEEDTGAYYAGKGTPKSSGYAHTNEWVTETVAHWDMDWSWGSENIPLAFPGFSVTITETDDSEYTVVLTPARAEGDAEAPGPVVNQDTGESFGTIQAAIDAASEGDTINVAAGTYEENVVIDKPLSLLGATAEINKNGYTIPGNYAWDDSIESIINNPTPPAGNEYTVVDIESVNNVTLKGFVIQALDIPAAANTQNLLRVNADTPGTCDSIVVQNNIIGPNTDLDEQDGTKGRMGLYLASPTYPSDGKGITNSTFSGNKIIDCLGNGNNVFVWGAAESYNSPANADYTGTVIEDNEICGSHRSGIEIAGGVDNLIIRNNKIHGNSGNGGEENAIKYGNGILIIRMGSDKSSATGMGPNGMDIVDNLIYDNEKNGIYLGPINKNLAITGNTFENNGWDGVRLDLTEDYHGSLCPVYNYVENIISVFNNITGNINCGIQIIGAPTNDFVLNATDNWWGCNDGPSTAEHPTSGDVVSGDIEYEPWTCCCCDKANTGCSNGCCSFDVSITSGDEELVVTEVEVSGDATVSVAKFHDNPTDGEVGGGGILFEGAYYDLKIPSDCCGNITELVFKIKLPDNYTGTPQPQYYNGANWIAFDEDTYEVSGGYLVITLTAATNPSLDQFEGTAVAVAKASSPSPTPSGGSGGGCNAGFAPAALLLIAPLFFLRRRK